MRKRVMRRPAQSRPPRGGRGLKFEYAGLFYSDLTSPPSRGAWIEINWLLPPFWPMWVSPPSRGAWIEIPLLVKLYPRFWVAPLAGGVD